VQH
jgi:hypothetical protein